MSGPVLEIRGLTIPLPPGADRPHAVEDLSLTVAPGETVCLVGESGSGKSLTAFSIMGLQPSRHMRPAAGSSIRLLGEELVGAGAARLRALRGSRMAMIFQEPMTALNPVASVGEQIAEVLRWHAGRLSAGESRERVLRLMNDVRLPDPAAMAHAYPHQLSGGQRQRIMIAMALALDPALLIADEPTTALDVTTQAQILTLLRDLKTRRDTGMLFITHDFGVVREIADRVLVMRAGRLVEQGSADAVLNRPTHPYTKLLIAAVPDAVPPPRDAPVGAPILTVKALAKTYGGHGLMRRQRQVSAVADAGFTIRRGEILGVVGESGSGKSTLARCVARLIEPSGGSILLDGVDIAILPERRLRPLRRRVQLVFQDPYRSLNPRQAVGASIIEGPRNFGMPRAEAVAKARELMGLVGLDPDALDRLPHQFSGGQRQRLCIARALALGPDLLIADEAVSALDVSVQAQVLDLLDDLRRRLDLAILFITHDLRVAARLCDTIAVMQAGRIVEQGAAAEIFARPRHAYTKALFAASPGRREPATA
ncbi:MAG TPA: ABC transporter ATP-binding protein [Aliidongia sp.]|uniref:ABC transporter ATP-binding protein n=1 Tax=Aliidongia sp. TaxID=1914230 RepID=UPI002DDCDBE5|nr:ABC transporter ATP-binding protein [Aliidongia sp.]HEV2673087.1 ABC transporter ATP-binding protein [Aliidongia sp.]